VVSKKEIGERRTPFSAALNSRKLAARPIKLVESVDRGIASICGTHLNEKLNAHWKTA
jgi:hypothetical protein